MTCSRRVEAVEWRGRDDAVVKDCACAVQGEDMRFGRECRFAYG